MGLTGRGAGLLRIMVAEVGREECDGGWIRKTSMILC